MGKLYPNEREFLINLIIYSLKKDVKKMVETIQELAIKFEVPDERKFERELYGIIEMVDENSLENIDIVTIFEKARKIFSDNQILLSEDIYLLIKGIGQIEGIGRHLDPNLNINEVMQPYMDKIVKERMNPINIFKKETRKLETFSENWLTLPTDLKTILEKIQKNELKHKHEIIGFEKFQKTFEGLVLAIIISSLFVGSSILALANIPPKIFGISGLGLLGFIIAGIMGIKTILKGVKCIKSRYERMIIMENNVLLATFKNQLSAFEALADIKEKYVGENYIITQAAVVKKESDKLSFKDGFEVNKNGNIGFLNGGLLGSFIGIIGGPLGVIFGGTIGALIGGSHGEKADKKVVGIFEDVSKYLVNDHYALILLTSESNTSELDNFLNKYETETILRKDAKIVRKDLELAEEYERKLKTDIEYKELKEKFENKSKEIKDNLDDFSEKVKVNAEAFTEDLTKFVLDLKNKFKK